MWEWTVSSTNRAGKSGYPCEKNAVAPLSYTMLTQKQIEDLSVRSKTLKLL